MSPIWSDGSREVAQTVPFVETRALEGYRLRTNLQFIFGPPLNSDRDEVAVKHQSE